MAKNNKIQARLTELRAEETRLFHSYNRHATAKFKLEILSDISSVVLRIEELNNLLK